MLRWCWTEVTLRLTRSGTEMEIFGMGRGFRIGMVETGEDRMIKENCLAEHQERVTGGTLVMLLVLLLWLYGLEDRSRGE